MRVDCQNDTGLLKLKKKDEKGQSTVEFALTMILLMAYLLFFFQLSMIFGFGNFVHYATFMSARALLSSSSGLEDQKSRSRQVILAMVKKSAGEAGVDKFPSIAKGTGEGDPPGYQVVMGSPAGNSGSDWMIGVRYAFKSKLFMIPMGGPGKGSSSANSVTLTSESFLGREPPDDECRSMMGKVKGLFDNGC